ncbi:SGNH/GDSL hydrolase family protein [Actinoplanes sp. CA-131856]
MERSRRLPRVAAALPAAALALTLAACGTAAPAHPAASSPPAQPRHLRVMPLGDSITMGAGSTTGAGYRGPLLDLVLRRNLFTMDYVGSQTSDGLADPQHEGHSGWRTDQISGHIGGWLATYEPDVILLHIGINDLHQGYPTQEALKRFDGLLLRIFIDRPNVTVIVGGLDPATPGLESKVAVFNTTARQLVADYASRGFHIRYVDMPLTIDQLKDKLHPNDAGYLTMAQSFDTALEQVGSS